MRTPIKLAAFGAAIVQGEHGARAPARELRGGLTNYERSHDKDLHLIADFVPGEGEED